MTECIIALDVGTSALKATAFDRNGSTLAQTKSSYQSEYGTDGQVEQDAETWIAATRAALCALGERASGEAPLKPAAIAVTSQRASVIPVDRDGRPLSRALMWQDTRSLGECEQIDSLADADSLYRRTGLKVNPYVSLARVLWLRNHRPELFDRAALMVGVQEIVVHALTGRFVTDWSQACRTMMFDIRENAWSQEILSTFDIPREKLPDLVPPGTVVGALRADMAQSVNVPAGTPVVACGGDQQNAALALGVIDEGIAEANTGTGAFALTASREPVFDSGHRSLCSVHALTDRWIVEAGIFNAGSIYQWFVERFAGKETGYAEIEAALNHTEPGANGLILVPHFHGSAAPYWDPLATGVMLNLTLRTRREDVARAILEGIAIEIGRNINLIESLTTPVFQVSVAGGLTSLELYNRIQASAFNRRVVHFENAVGASSLGAALNAAVTIGWYENHSEALVRMRGETEMRKYAPGAEAADHYRRQAQTADRAYHALSEAGIYRAIRESAPD